MSFLLAAIGGALGGACRYLLSNGMVRCCSAGFPWGTLAVNSLGCLLLGVSLGAGLSVTEKAACRQMLLLRLVFVVV